jgi:hypothetical protein
MNIYSVTKYNTALLLKENSEHYIFEKKVNIRTKPSVKSKVLALAVFGDPIIILERTKIKQEIYDIKAYWYQIEWKGKIGYIWGGLVSTMQETADFNKDGKNEILLSRCVSDKEVYADDYMSKFSHNLRLFKDGKMIDQKLFNNKILTSSSIQILESYGFSPEVTFVEFLFNFGDDAFFTQNGSLYYYKGEKFYYICSYSKQQDPNKFKESNITFPKENKIKNTIVIENLEATFDPKNGNLKEKLLKSKIYYKWSKGRFRKIKEEKLNKRLE